VLCTGCGYNLKNLPVPVCPECGRRFNPLSAAPWSERRYRAARFAVFLSWLAAIWPAFVIGIPFLGIWAASVELGGLDDVWSFSNYFENHKYNSWPFQLATAAALLFLYGSPLASLCLAFTIVPAFRFQTTQRESSIRANANVIVAVTMWTCLGFYVLVFNAPGLMWYFD
jgi:hypothetical protein